MSDRILVTGGAGFIGSHVCERLLERGNEVWLLDNFDDHYAPELKRRNVLEIAKRPSLHVVEGDVRDPVLTGGLLSDIPFSVVVHLAARPGVEASMDNPDTSYEMNVRGTLRLLEIMGRHDVRRLVLGSSSAVYGDRAQLPFAESDAADRPVSPYGASKRAAEMLAHTYHRLQGFAVHCLRLFTVYGPRQRPEMAIHRFARQMAEGSPLTLHGDGSSVRDYVHVDDATAAILLAVDDLVDREDPVYEAINVGSGEPVTLSELVDALSRAFGADPAVDHLPASPWRSAATCASLEKAGDLLGYSPSVGLEEGLHRFADWFRTDRADGAPTQSDGSVVGGARRPTGNGTSPPAETSAPGALSPDDPLPPRDPEGGTG